MDVHRNCVNQLFPGIRLQWEGLRVREGVLDGALGGERERTGYPGIPGGGGPGGPGGPGGVGGGMSLV